MKDSTRRILLFVCVVITGSILVLFDIPAIVMIIGIIALAVVVLFINGSIHLPKLPVGKNKVSKTKSGDASGKSPGGTPGKKWSLFQAKGSAVRATEGQPRQGGVRKPASGLFGDFFSSMSRAFSVLAGDISRAGKPGISRDAKKKKIDEMLDGSIAGRVSDIRSLKEANPEMIPVSRKVIDDPFTTLVKKPINTELLDSTKDEVDIASLSDINLDEGIETPSFGEDISRLDVALDVEEEKITIDDDSDDEVANILAAHQDELDTVEKGSESQITSDITNLEELDIGSIDLDEDLDIDDELPEPDQPGSVAGPARIEPQKEPEKAAAPPPPMEKPKSMEDSMVAFSTGKGEDDDLMSSLKSEAGKTKKESHASLIRDLKDVKVPVQDLERELEGFLAPVKTKK